MPTQRVATRHYSLVSKGPCCYFTGQDPILSVGGASVITNVMVPYSYNIDVYCHIPQIHFKMLLETSLAWIIYMCIYIGMNTNIRVCIYIYATPQSIHGFGLLGRGRLKVFSNYIIQNAVSMKFTVLSVSVYFFQTQGSD